MPITNIEVEGPVSCWGNAKKQEQRTNRSAAKTTLIGIHVKRVNTKTKNRSCLLQFFGCSAFRPRPKFLPITWCLLTALCYRVGGNIS